LPSPISIQQILWRGGGQLCQGNSGYYAVKQLWKNASSIHRKSIGDRGGLGHYLHMISKLEADLEEDEDGDGVKTHFETIGREKSSGLVFSCFMAQFAAA
jgi:hypothetical protein